MACRVSSASNLSTLQLLLQLDTAILVPVPRSSASTFQQNVGHGEGGLLSSLPPAAYQLSAAQDEPLPLPLEKGAALTDHTVFPGAAWFVVSHATLSS